MEAWHWMTGDVLSSSKLAAELLSYGCTAKQVEDARWEFSKAAKMIAKGHYKSDTVKVAIRSLS
jgi:hypothetical protein